MSGGGGDAPPPANGGQFILQLLKRPPQHPSNPSLSPPSEAFPHDPAVAAFGPTIPFSSPTQFPPPPNGQDHVAYHHHDHHHHHSPSQVPRWPDHQSLLAGFAPHHFFPQNSSPNPNTNLIPNFSTSPPLHPPGFTGVQQLNHQLRLTSPLADEMQRLGFLGTDPRPSSSRPSDLNLNIGAQLNGNMKKDFGQVEGLYGKGREICLGDTRGFDSLEVEFQNSMSSHHNLGGNVVGFRGNGQERCGSNGWDEKGQGVSYRAPPPGFSSNSRSGGNKEYERGSRSFEQTADKVMTSFVDLNYRNVNFTDKDGNTRWFTQRNNQTIGDGLDDWGVGKQLDFPGPPAGITLNSVSKSDVVESMMELHGENDASGDEIENDAQQRVGKGGSGYQYDLDCLEEQLVDSLGLDEHSGEKANKVKRRDKDYRSDKRGQWILGQRDRISKRRIPCRSDIERLNAPFLAIYQSLIPAEEEKAKQKKLLSFLEKLVSKEWPDARLYVYGSCANSFGFSKSDIDICLAIQGTSVNKSEVLLKLAEILQSDNLENVQALTRARVPIVKLMDPNTGIACDICINNVLAVINTKLLRDYAKIDSRLKQLAFIVKHWAKSRGVNETYQGTLSSYAYILMCINFLQLRKPAILPCLQGMKPTYSVHVDDIQCAYFDEVEKLRGFGSQNGESIAKLVWAFFHYWAYCHDYTNEVISVRAGNILSKRLKDWTRRIGNDRHLICIEDPFEMSHDLGRVVDRSSIRVLREEFERAADILQYDPDPCVKLFEPYVPS